MPGYWREPELTADAFDDEGFYRTGDAVNWVDPADPDRGMMFDGRIAEDFKLSTGTFVSVGPLRARIIAAGAPCVQDVVVAGPNRDEIAMLLFPRLDECRKLAGLAPTRRRRRCWPLRRCAISSRRSPTGCGQTAPAAPTAWRAPRAGGAAVDRQGRGDRQGVDQPARGADASRRAGRCGLQGRARRPRRDRRDRGAHGRPRGS